MSSALTAIISQTYNSILSKLFSQHEIDYTNCSTYNELIQEAEKLGRSDLAFVSREMLRDNNLPVEKAISQLREKLKGSIYVLSSNDDQKDIEQYIQAGATDVILHSQINQIEQILKSYRVYLDTINESEPYSVLLVEDSKSLSITIQKHLKTEGMVVHSATRAEDGLKILNEKYIDVIICDLVLEGNLTGLELVRQTYQSSRWKGIPLLMTTAFSDADRQKHFYRLGVSDVMSKPYDLEILTLKVLALAREHRVHKLLIAERSKIEKMAFEDPETGLKNRAYLRAQFDEWLQQQSNRGYAFLIEIDDYQEIKRQYGINQCEIALKTVADVLAALSPENAIISHLTGEQFVILLGDIEKEIVEKIAEKIINDISSQKIMEHNKLSVSIGIAESHENISLNDILKIADGCLFLAKEDGPGHFVIT